MVALLVESDAMQYVDDDTSLFEQQLTYHRPNVGGKELQTSEFAELEMLSHHVTTDYFVRSTPTHLNSVRDTPYYRNYVKLLIRLTLHLSPRVSYKKHKTFRYCAFFLIENHCSIPDHLVQ